MDSQGDTLIVYYDNGAKPIFGQCFRESGADFFSWYPGPFLFKVGRFYSRHRHNHASAIDSWVYRYPPRGPYRLIVVFDTVLPRGYVNGLRLRFPDARIVLWYWNEIKSYNEALMRAEGEDIWSYSPADCERYGLRHNTPFYFDSVVERHADEACFAGALKGERDFVFMGRDKGRAETIAQIADELRAVGWDCKTEIFLASNDDLPTDAVREPVGYEALLAETLAHQGILDVTAADTSGPSLRIMESVFFHRKLITTNTSVTEYDFFDPDNMYVWGHADMELSEFLSRPYRPVPREVADRYLLSSWLSRIEDAYAIGR